jgi:SNF2 family DNA or RNA helicase
MQQQEQQQQQEQKMQLYMDMLDHAGLAFNQHQYDGVEFCVLNELTVQFGVRGGIIADEMGLGKTLTAIGTMVANPLPNTLIVLPPVLLLQWQKEIFRATGIQALVYHGTQKKQITERELMTNAIVLTTYNAIRPTNILHGVKWDRVVFDEAHHLRNKNLALSGAVALNAKIRWLITGTPIQNSANDFSNLCSALGLDRSIYTDKALARSIISTFVLKRSKAMVPSTNLPSVITRVVSVEWSDTEYALAKEIHSTLGFSNVEHCDGPYATKLGGSGVLQRILRAKQSCVLPSLMDSELKKCRLGKQYSTTNTSKIDAVIAKIEETRDNGSGKLIFCHYRNEIDAIASRLTSAGIRNATFDGRTSAPEREAILNDNVLVIILQIQTGCEGLNLQKNYSEIYFVSPHWNPSVEAQAIGRCHRMGQKKQVYVFRFEMVGFEEQEQQEQQEQQDDDDSCSSSSLSLDMYIMTIQSKKRGITDAILEAK